MEYISNLKYKRLTEKKSKTNIYKQINYFFHKETSREVRIKKQNYLDSRKTVVSTSIGMCCDVGFFNTIMFHVTQGKSFLLFFFF